MSQRSRYLAIDLGAESGRVILGEFDGKQIRLSDVHRFPNGPVKLPDGLHWDVLHVWTEIKAGIALARKPGEALASIGIDTWGVDYGLLDRHGALLSNPYHYRDSRTDGMLEKAFRRMPREQIFELTGIQFMPINTLYQLLSMAENQSPVLDIAETFLTMPDLLNYWLTGQKVCEFSNVTTTQCYDPRQRAWSESLLKAMDIPLRIFPPIIEPGTVLGPLLPAVAKETGAGAIPVIAPACHDTGSAVAAVPAAGHDFAWISSGTWSIMGTESREPVITPASLAFNFTNEGGVCGTFRLCKNVMGLWLVQECRRAWARAGEELSYDTLVEMAQRASPFRSLIDPDDDDFLRPGDMPARFGEFCRRTNQPVPEDKGAVIRCALESLALKYRFQLERLERLLGKHLLTIHIIGGGTQNRLLCQFTADATGRRVIAGPIEAAALGNVLMQALALGHLGSLSEGRQVIARSFELAAYEPHEPAPWDEAYQRFCRLLGN